MYPLLRKGDRLPSVAIVQIMINRKMRQGSYIAVDGIFGRQTRDAVLSFQKGQHLSRDGIVGKNTWGALIRGEGIVVLDTVDITDPGDMGYEDQAIKSAGGKPIVNFGMCNGVKVTMLRIQSRANSGKISLLRFHGHGAPGVMSLSTGTGSEISSEFGTDFLPSLARYLERYRSVFSPLGSVELHGCRVGAGRDGKRLIRALARAWGVPVTAGIRSQYGGGRSTFRFEGPTITAIPGGKSLKEWARSLPVAEVHGMSVAR